MSSHVVQWVTASPLWSDTLTVDGGTNRETAMQKPALLRFERDTFMQDVAKLLESDPGSLKSTLATPVTYRLPAPGETEPPAPTDLKLYQAVHGHFYLVGGSLVCRLPGLPDHDVATAVKETVTFVLRRLDDADENAEWAWVDDPDAEKGKSWLKLEPGATGELAVNEEQLPLFPLRYNRDDRVRTVFVGLVPTTSADAFKAAGTLSPLAPADGASGAAPLDPRPDALKAKVTDQLRALVAAAAAAPEGPPDARQPLIEASQFVLLDFAQFLHDNLGWFPSASWTGPTDAKGATLWAILAAPVVTASSTSWRSALATAWTERLILSGDAEGTSALQLNLDMPGLTPDAIDAAVVAALPELPTPDPAGPAVSIQGDVVPPPAVPKLDTRSASHYVIRCVYRRPECGALCPDVVSARSATFRIASFFDLDAPSRTITIAMPIDTSIKDLRKLRKSVNFMLSNELRQQMNRVTSLKDALDGKFADAASVDLGLICSFSIPIITICALLVLMIFISLLNIVFWWSPFLKICFPIGLKAK